MMISSDPGQDESTSDPGLHSLLQGRFSPLTFDPDHELVPAHVNLLLEAARVVGNGLIDLGHGHVGQVAGMRLATAR